MMACFGFAQRISALPPTCIDADAAWTNYRAARMKFRRADFGKPHAAFAAYLIAATETRPPQDKV